MARHSGKLVTVVGKATRAATATLEEVETQVGLIAVRSAMRAGVSGIFGTAVMRRNRKMEDLFVNTRKLNGGNNQRASSGQSTCVISAVDARKKFEKHAKRTRISIGQQTLSKL